MKSQNSSTKSQINLKSQYSMTKIAIRVVSHRLVNPSLSLMTPLAQLWGLNLTWATLHFVDWVEQTLGFVGFLRLRRTNLHFISSIAQYETQQRPILEPSPNFELILYLAREETSTN
jgi:hypothetical protein